ncbi:MAG: M48 family metallopeptidase [Magnetospirillum sp. WYHS-4]
MTMLHRRGFVLGLGASGLLAAAPAVAQLSLGDVVGGAAQLMGALSIKEEDEIKMGQSYYPGYLTKSGGAYSDRNAQEALRKFAEPFISTSDRKNLPWEITLVDNKQVNAWALPGGKIAVNSELVRYADDPAELGSVIAHEIGHAELSHSAKQMRNQAFLTTIGGAGKQLVASWMGSAAPLGAEVLSALEGPLYTMVLTGYSRANEFEADNHILGVFQKTGMDPQRAGDFFKTLKTLYPDNSSETTSLFSTHPGTQSRIDKLADAAKALARPSKPANVPGWVELKSKFPTPAGFKKG